MTHMPIKFGFNVPFSEEYMFPDLLRKIRQIKEPIPIEEQRAQRAFIKQWNAMVELGHANGWLEWNYDDEDSELVASKVRKKRVVGTEYAETEEEWEERKQRLRDAGLKSPYDALNIDWNNVAFTSQADHTIMLNQVDDEEAHDGN